MKLLLHTRTFIWWDSEPAKLSLQAMALCQEECFVAKPSQHLGSSNQTSPTKTQASLALERGCRNSTTNQQHPDIAC
ncbi:MAG TPA: hypothetical protein VNM72_14795 [Blastocatellia bacterium]|nr:hypothetical protein [Blastocatellia bacterium]